jgi:hypothetical protein
MKLWQLVQVGASAGICLILGACPDGIQLGWPEPQPPPAPSSGPSMTLSCDSGTLDLGESVTVVNPQGNFTGFQPLGANISNGQVCTAIGMAAGQAHLQYQGLGFTTIKIFGVGVRVTVVGASTSCSNPNCSS